MQQYRKRRASPTDTSGSYSSLPLDLCMSVSIAYARNVLSVFHWNEIVLKNKVPLPQSCSNGKKINVEVQSATLFIKLSRLFNQQNAKNSVFVDVIGVGRSHS